MRAYSPWNEAAVKILIVEDEPKTGDYLRQGLMEAGFVVDLARDGLDGLHLALNGDYDLVVLDVMLPSLDGWGVLQTVRRSGREMPVLFLTARDKVEDRVRGRARSAGSIKRQSSCSKSSVPMSWRSSPARRTTSSPRAACGTCRYRW